MVVICNQKKTNENFPVLIHKDCFLKQTHISTSSLGIVVVVSMDIICACKTQVDFCEDEKA